MSNSDRQILVTRAFEAPRELVFEAWTKPEHVVRWWGPNGFTTTMEEMDVRPGGGWKYTMHGPDGTNYPNKSVFVEVVRPERLVYTHGGTREGGPGVSFTATVTFEECLGRTTVTMQLLFPSVEGRDHAVREYNALEGGQQTLGRLAAYVATLLPEVAPVFSVSRTFNAPRQLVFQAWSEAEHLNRWWGPKGFETKSLRLDFRPGGLYHYSSKMPDGTLIYGTFLYREIVAPERIVFLNGFADEACNLARHPLMPDWPRQILNVLTLEEQDGKTNLSLRGQPHEPTEAEQKAFREALKYLTPGFNGTFDQLETYLAAIQEAE